MGTLLLRLLDRLWCCLVGPMGGCRHGRPRDASLWAVTFVRNVFDGVFLAVRFSSCFVIVSYGAATLGAAVWLCVAVCVVFGCLVAGSSGPGRVLRFCWTGWVRATRYTHYQPLTTLYLDSEYANMDVYICRLNGLRGGGRPRSNRRVEKRYCKDCHRHLANRRCYSDEKVKMPNDRCKLHLKKCRQCKLYLAETEFTDAQWAMKDHRLCKRHESARSAQQTFKRQLLAQSKNEPTKKSIVFP